MGPYNYTRAVRSPVDEILRMVGVADQKKARAFDQGLRTRQADRADRQDELRQQNTIRAYDRGVLESDRNYDRAIEQDALRQKNADRGYHLSLIHI